MDMRTPIMDEAAAFIAQGGKATVADLQAKSLRFAKEVVTLTDALLVANDALRQCRGEGNA